MSVLFPRPFSDTISISLPWVSSCIPTTSSSYERLIPITPIEVLPVLLTSPSENLIHNPFFVTRSICLLPSVTLTSIRSSSPWKLIACIPVFLILANSLILVFFTIPFFVAIKRYWSSSKLSTGITAVIFSSAISWRILTIAIPLAVLEASGISYALSLYTRPLLVKNKRVWWDVVINNLSR